MQESITTSEKKNKVKKDYNIIVVIYVDNIQNFQSIAENIIIEMNEIFSQL